MDQRISLVTLGAANLEHARTFYQALSWEPAEPQGEDIVFFQAGGMIVALWGRDKLAEDSCVEDEGGWGGVTLAYCVGSPGEVDRVIEEVRTAGARIGRKPDETFWGGYSGVFIDPDEHPWEAAWNPAWTLDADGSVRLSSRWTGGSEHR